MSAATHPYFHPIASRSFVGGLSLQAVGALAFATGLWLLADLLTAVVAVTVAAGIISYLVGRWLTQRSWDYIAANDATGQEPMWMLLTMWALTAIPVGAALARLALSNPAESALALVLAVFFGPRAFLRSRAAEKSKTHLSIAWANVLLAGVISVLALLGLLGIVWG